MDKRGNILLLYLLIAVTMALLALLLGILFALLT